MKKRIRKSKNSSGKGECQICFRRDFLEIHHINGRKIPNSEMSFNLVDICGCCHTAIHMGEIIVEGYISTLDGKELIWHKKNEESITGNDSSVHLFKKADNH